MLLAGFASVPGTGVAKRKRVDQGALFDRCVGFQRNRTHGTGLRLREALRRQRMIQIARRYERFTPWRHRQMRIELRGFFKCLLRPRPIVCVIRRQAAIEKRLGLRDLRGDGAMRGIVRNGGSEQQRRDHAACFLRLLKLCCKPRMVRSESLSPARSCSKASTSSSSVSKPSRERGERDG